MGISHGNYVILFMHNLWNQMFRWHKIKLGSLLILRISILAILLMSFAILQCAKKEKEGVVPVQYPYVLPAAHLDNSHPMKQAFFMEAFRDLDGKLVHLGDFRGMPMVILMFPSFRTSSGQESLLTLERVIKERQGSLIGVVIPVEKAEDIKPAIVGNPEDIKFLFREGKSNQSLLDKYSELFWDKGLIAVDYPWDRVEQHLSCPFFWVVDRSGTIREKLIDYSARRGITLADLASVLDAFLGPVVSEASEEESVQSSVLEEEIK